VALKRRRLPRAVPLQVGREGEAGTTRAQAARASHVPPTVRVRWRPAHLRDAAQALMGHGRRDQEEARLAARACLASSPWSMRWETAPCGGSKPEAALPVTRLCPGLALRRPSA
jgi:hypothetical protein